MGAKETLAPSLPLWCSVPISAVVALGIIYLLFRMRSTAGRFLVFACWFRFLVAAFKQYSYNPSPAGLSWIALSSIGLVGLGILVLDKRRLFIWPFFPVVIVCSLMLISAFMNHNPIGCIEPIVRNCFFVMITVALWQTIDSEGPEALTRLLWVFVLPILLQICSIVLNVPKAGESDGSVSYIGGYNHEQLFSMILASCFVVASFATQIRRWVKVAVSMVSLAGIAAANYRTTILGMAPLVAAQLLTGVPAAMKPGQRPFVRTAIIVFGVVGLVAVGTADPTRFADVATVVSKGTSVIKPPESFSSDDRRLLSGRPYIWSNYIYAYYRGSRVQKIFGFGPDSWSTLFDFYAHNTLVSYLYELGVLGVGAILLLWGTMLSVAWRVQRKLRAQVLAAHASFFLLNMATMPHWQIEGNILYGLICGYTLANARARRSAPKSQSGSWSRPEEFGPRSIGVPAPAR